MLREFRASHVAELTCLVDLPRAKGLPRNKSSHSRTIEDTLDFECEVINDSQTTDFADDLIEINHIDENKIVNKNTKQSIQM